MEFFDFQAESIEIKIIFSSDRNAETPRLKVRVAIDKKVYARTTT